MSLPRLPVFESIVAHAGKRALTDARLDRTVTYAQLLSRTLALRTKLLSEVGKANLEDVRVALLCPPGLNWSVAQLAVWAAGGAMTPLADRHPLSEMEHAVKTAAVSVLIAHESFAARASELAEASGIEHVVTVTDSDAEGDGVVPSFADVDFEQPAMILFTGKPKAAVHTHRSLAAQADSIAKCWGITAEDNVHSVLPMNHIHGTVNAVHTALSCGASLETMHKFDGPGLTVFHAVPTIYSRLEGLFDKMSPDEQARASAAAKAFRLQVSGSAALPVSLKQRWHEISGHVLLERIGMTETGMILSCGLDESTRIDAHVGTPMPGVEARLWDLDNHRDVTAELDTPGELQLKAPQLFSGYYGQPDVTAKEFADGWFKTGDVAQRTSPHGSFRILGRASMDMINGGEKLSSLEIEFAILSLPPVQECAVVGVPDEAWGAVPGAVLVLKDADAAMELAELKELLRPHLAAYKLPQKIHIAKTLPRNVMGKVLKKQVLAEVWPQPQ